VSQIQKANNTLVKITTKIYVSSAKSVERMKTIKKAANKQKE